MINRKSIRYSVFAIAAVLLIVGMLPKIGTSRLAVSPLTLKMEIPPGEISSKNLTIRNTGQDPVSVNIQLVDWWRTPEGNLQLLAPGARDRSCVDWMLYSTEALTMEPGEKRQVTIEVDVPEDERGDHWAMLLITEQPEEANEDQPVTTRVTVNYAVKILQQDPTTNEKEAKVTGLKLVNKAPLELAIDFKNDGPTHLQTTGRAEIRNLQGETIREYEISKFPTLPGEERIIEVGNTDKYDEPLEPGTYYAIVVMDFGGDNLVQGGLPVEIPEGEEETG